MAKFHQNIKPVNKVMAQSVKNLKSMLFHCDVTDGVSIMHITTNIALNAFEKVQLKQIVCDEIITVKVKKEAQPT